MLLFIGSWYPLSPRRESPENEVDCSFCTALFQHTLPSQGNTRSIAGMEGPILFRKANPHLNNSYEVHYKILHMSHTSHFRKGNTLV